MDTVWERSVPFCSISTDEITDIFKEYDKHIEIADYTPINIGCINSNYKVLTDKGCYFLRVCPLNDFSYKKERTISEAFRGRLNVPRLLFVSENNSTQRTCLLYEYIQGDSMQEVMQRGYLEDNMIVQAAESASRIHNSTIVNWEFDEEYPPFETWYDLFLDNEMAAERIGQETKERVQKLIADKKSDLYEIERYTSFIHSDFRPANMLIDENNRVWIVDWEFSGFGHSLTDIGQFFRYDSCFQPKQIRLFEEAYNRSSHRQLPPDWYKLSKLLDLVNPLQMLGAKENLPQKYADLKNLIVNTLDFFGY